jgi:excinuclease UvrABC ATPase subunit
MRRHALVIFAVSGSGKSSLVFGTLYIEAQLLYLESVRRAAPFPSDGRAEVDESDGLRPTVALFLCGMAIVMLILITDLPRAREAR